MINIEEIFKYCPQNTPVYLISSNHRLYIGTTYYDKERKDWFRGECLQGDPDCFYREAIVNWAFLEKEKTNEG